MEDTEFKRYTRLRCYRNHSRKLPCAPRTMMGFVCPCTNISLDLEVFLLTIVSSLDLDSERITHSHRFSGLACLNLELLPLDLKALLCAGFWTGSRTRAVLCRLLYRALAAPPTAQLRIVNSSGHFVERRCAQPILQLPLLSFSVLRASQSRW